MRGEHRRHFRRMHEEMHAHMRAHMRGHHLHGWRGEVWKWRSFIAAHLHRRLFLWFGVSIFMSVTVANLVHGMVGRGRGHWLFAMLAAGLVLWLVSGKIAYRIARPLHELLRVTEEIGAGRLSARAELPRGRHAMGEMAYIASAINDMATRIQKQVGDQRELLAGVSHEIRTPLARIRVLLELGRSRGGDAKTFDELEREVVEIDALVGQLLASARLDFADLSVRALDGADVARRALERAGVSADLLDVVPPGAALSFEGDATLLARALANLLENARRHGGGVTRLAVSAPRPDVVAFEVEDAGPGFPAAGEAREKQERHEGSLGLGLVLVRRIADAHRGVLTMGNRVGGGARVRLEVSRPGAGAEAGAEE